MGMEGDDAGRGTTVPFLVAVRFVVAIAVGAATFAVIVLVIAMVRRPEEVQLAIDRGYIPINGGYIHGNASDNDYDDDNDNDYDNDYQEASSPAPATAQTQTSLFLTVSLTASYSSRRGHQDSINCTNITVGLVDVTLSASSWDLSQLPADIKETMVQFQVQNSFMVLKDTSHTEATMVNITGKDAAKMKERISEEHVFKVLVMVHIVTLPPSPPPDTHNAPNYTFYCWPVIVGYGYKNLQATDDDVECKKIGSSQVPGHNWAPVIN